VLSAIDRGIDLNTKLVVPRREDESMEHVVLRVLAYCLFCHDERGGGLRLAPGPADRDGPDLWSHHPEGRPDEWIICGDPDIEDLRYVMQHQRQAKIRILLGSPEERERLFAGLHSFRRTLPGLEAVDVREVDQALVQALVGNDQERQRWVVTMVEDHIYIDADAVTADGEVRSITAAAVSPAGTAESHA
jgi:uncharacterized protein YaeQ